MASEWNKLMDHLEGEEIDYEQDFEEKYAEAIAQPDIAETISEWTFQQLKFMKEFIYEYWLKEQERLGGWKKDEPFEPTSVEVADMSFTLTLVEEPNVDSE